jgi:hypothetical protein
MALPSCWQSWCGLAAGAVWLLNLHKPKEDYDLMFWNCSLTPDAFRALEQDLR